ncbi:uncharacterized protein [Littorina saxatilis]|uniref:uncharacterized protein n=1 Tax=Littorina saxatilis TaxID=31220 RepID=UPI0038B66E1A
MASLMCVLCGKSSIGPILEQEALMRNILDVFVEFGHLYFDELIDKLIASGVLQPKHHDIITVQRERSQIARQLWMLLLRIPPKKFKEQVQPVLEELGLWREETSFQAKTEMCLRCVMEHMMPIEELADKLVTEGFLRGAEYRDVVKSRLFEISKWELIFDCLKREHSNACLLEICENLLEEFEIPVPPRFSQILEIGIPCACSAKPDTRADEGEAAEAPTGPLCNTCRAPATFPRQDSQLVLEELHANIEQPTDETADEVELRPRSCCHFRKQRMAQTHRFQKDVMKPMTSKRLSG